jgi:putative oxidoreductase
MNILSWIFRIVIAVILLQTLFFKFTGAEESKYIFTTLMGENEAVGRIGSGIVELLAVVLLFVPQTTWLGAILALGTMSGAIFSHLTKLGISVKDDGGLLFGLAITVFILSAAVLFLSRKEIPFVGQMLFGVEAKQ